MTMKELARLSPTSPGGVAHHPWGLPVQQASLSQLSGPGWFQVTSVILGTQPHPEEEADGRASATNLTAKDRKHKPSTP